MMSRPDWSSTSPEQRGRVALRGVDPHVTEGRVDLYWLPLGAGGRCVRANGRMYEGIVARLAGREPLALYHSALEVQHAGERFVIEMAPVWNNPDPQRGVVGEGPVGLRGLGRSRLFRYEVRCWRDGHIPDVDEASRARNTSATTASGRDAFSTCCRPSLDAPGEPTNSTPATCGTPTRSSPGCWLAAVTTSPP